MKKEGNPISERVKVNIEPAPLNCYLDDSLEKTIEGVRVHVDFDGAPVWEKKVRTRIPASMLGYMPIPFYGARIRKAQNQANKVAKSLS